METEQKKPLFNRNYLKGLVLLLPIAIVLLHRLGAQEPLSEQIGFYQTPQYRLYTLPVSDDQFELHGLIALPDSPSAAGDEISRLLFRGLQERLQQADVSGWLQQQQWQVSLQPASANMLIKVQLPALPSIEQLNQFWALLGSGRGINWATLVKTAQAETYIAQQKDNQRLQMKFGELAKLMPPQGDIVSQYNALFARPAIWTLTGPELAAYPSDPTPTDTSTTQVAALPSPLATQTQLPLLRQNQAFLLGQRLEVIHSGEALAEQKLSATAAQALIQSVKPKQANSSYEWHAGAEAGYQFIQASHWPIAQARQQLTTAIDQLDSQNTQQFAKQLKQQFEQISEQTPQQWLDMIALYALPLDSDQAFRAKLDAFTVEQLQARLRALVTASPDQIEITLGDSAAAR